MVKVGSSILSTSTGSHLGFSSGGGDVIIAEIRNDKDYSNISSDF